MKAVGRNDSCPCGSGKKYKRCCAAQVTKGLKARVSMNPASRTTQAFAQKIMKVISTPVKTAPPEEDTSDHLIKASSLEELIGLEGEKHE